MTVEWTEAHRREALRRTYEIAAELAGEGRRQDAEDIAMRAHEMSLDRESWEATLYVGDGPALSEDRIDREVRRVDALATGRLARETVWQVRGKHAAEEDGLFWDSPNYPPLSVREDRTTVRVTCIRRASRH